jgi:Tfp pilus assembly pilus retraction ATPase PilT
MKSSWKPTFLSKCRAWPAFRVNAFNQNRGAGAVFRTIPSKVLTMEDLGMGKVFQSISDTPRGIVLVTGPTGSGKSTTLAAMLDYINNNRYEHILTIEDPIEFVHESKNVWSTSVKCTATPSASPRRCAPPCVKTPTSSSWVKCVTLKPFAWR